ncbi:MAG: ABC transporter ATP-binding protein [Deltaproteobacteria bacterium]|nr:ABC transporter ATP-binding protein [Deltaproteobacteria bacterium]
MNPILIEDLHYCVQPHFWSRRKTVLRGVSFNVAPGEIFGFLGPNGAGKTTTIKALLGLLKPKKGVVQIFGAPVTQVATRKRIGFMPERAYFPEYLSAHELLLLHGILAGLSPKQSLQRIDKVLELVGMRAVAHERLGGMSKGMQQRVGLGQSLIAEPELVILDEPMSGLDPIGRHDVRQIMLNLKAAGKTVFFSTHILPDVESICDRVAILVEGSVRKLGTIDTLLEETAASVEIIAQGCNKKARQAAAALALVSSQRFDADVFVAQNSDAANQIIDTLRKAQAQIVAVQTQRRSLEEVFVAESLNKIEASAL